jgi:parallel beta-helix repeat protein
MGVGEWTPWPRAKKAILALGIAFAILTVSIIAFALVAEGAYTDKRFKPHSPIFIDGDADFGLAEGVTGGSGTEVDPFVIEGWEIFVVGSCAISVNNTDAHLVIRNVSLNANWYSYSGATSPIGISLKNASNVRIESSFISYFQSGVRANGTLGVTEGIEISGCTFTSTGQHVMISNTSDCLVTHSFFSGFYDRVLLISNCTSVMCSFNKISAQYYSYFGTYAVAVKFENVTGSNLEENDISGYGSNLWIVDAYDATIRNNSFRGNDYQYDVVAERCTRVLFSRNEISAGEGILAKGCSNTTIDANYLHPGMYARGSMGLSASSSVGTVISGNTIVRGEGIIVTDSRNSNVYDNYVSGAGITSYSEQVSGMMTYGCYNLTISRNIFVDCTASGLYLSGVNITVEGNEISHNSLRGDPYSYSGAGLTASGSNLSIRNNKISSNTVSWNTTPSTSPGILLRMISNSTFEGNNVSDDVELEYCDNLSVRSNAFAGGWNLSVLSWTDKTVFEHNNFPESIMIDVDGNTAVTFWDAGYPSGGNYWSSYIGEDLMSGPSQDIPGPDGFGDTAYQMSGGEMDYYPRMRPANDQDVLPPVTIAICNGTLGDRMLRYMPSTATHRHWILGTASTLGLGANTPHRYW